MVLAVVRVRAVGARHDRHRGARTTAHHALRPTAVDPGGRCPRRAGGGAGRLLARDDPAVRGAADLRGAGEPAGRAPGADRHRRRPRCVSARAGLAVGWVGPGSRCLGPRVGSRRHRPRCSAAAVRVGAVAGWSRRGGRRRGRQREPRGRRAEHSDGAEPPVARRGSRRRGRCRRRRGSRAGRARFRPGHLGGRGVRRRTGRRRAGSWRRQHGPDRHRGRSWSTPGMPRPAGGPPDRPARPHALRPRPRGSGGRGHGHRRHGARRTRRPCVGQPRRAGPAARWRRRPAGRRPGGRRARAARLARGVAAGGQPGRRQRREHRARDRAAAGRRLPHVRVRGVPRRPGGDRAASAPLRQCAPRRSHRRREGLAPRFGRPGPAAVPAARGPRRTRRRRRGQHLRPPDTVGVVDARIVRDRHVPHRRTRDRRGGSGGRRRPAGVDGAHAVGGRP